MDPRPLFGFYPPPHHFPMSVETLHVTLVLTSPTSRPWVSKPKVPRDLVPLGCLVTSVLTLRSRVHTPRTRPHPA